jgi:pimeloyl-ACP methyl ester carboxylesterase
MFRAFEPTAPAGGEGRVLLSVGQLSPPVRHASVRRLSAALRLPAVILPGSGHAVHLENPAVFAAAVATLAAAVDPAATGPAAVDPASPGPG